MTELVISGDIARKRKLQDDAGEASKRARAPEAPSDEGANEWTRAQDLQTQCLQIDKEVSQEIVRLQHESAVRKRPLMQQRGEHLRQIEAFWVTALCNSHVSGHISEADKELLQYLDAIDVTRPSQDKVCIELTFADDNPILASTSLERTLETSEDDGIHASCSDVQWKTDLTAEVDEGGQPLLKAYTFLEWFITEGVFVDDPVADELTQTIWDNPLHFFLGGDAEFDIEAQEAEDVDNTAEFDLDGNDDSLRAFAEGTGGDDFGVGEDDDDDDAAAAADGSPQDEVGDEEGDEEEEEEEDGDDTDAL